MIKKKKEQNANRIKELYNRETKFDKILKVKKKKRSKKQDQKDEDRIKNSSESEYDHEKFSFDNVSSKKKKPKQNRSNPKISSRKQFFLEQWDKLRECPKPSRPVYCKPVIFQSANTLTTLPKPIVYNVDPRLSKFIGLKKGLQCVITSWCFLPYLVGIIQK